MWNPPKRYAACVQALRRSWQSRAWKALDNTARRHS
jgi:hypothetical protein